MSTPTRAGARGSARPRVVIDAPDRFAEGPRTARRRRWLRALLVLLCLAAFAGVAWLLGWSTLLDVRTVEVVGAQRSSDSLIALTADVPPGTPLARVDTGGVKDRVGQLPVVHDVQVQRVWPHTLRIVITERTPVAVVMSGDALRLVDADGVAFASVSAAPRNVPLLELDLDHVPPADLAAGLAVIDALPPTLARKVAAVTVQSPDDVQLNLRSGAVIVWGDASRPVEKAAVVKALLGQHAERYDVSAPDAPTTLGGD